MEKKKKRFQKAYLEITNLCNLQCSFCPGTKRVPRMLEKEQFTLLAQRLRPYTDHLYFHLMGEPLIHPLLGDFFQIAGTLGFSVTITTNGTLLSEKGDILLSAPALRKVSVSLHSFEANQADDFDGYLARAIDFCRRASKKGIYSVMRLWNLDGEKTFGQHSLNDEIIDRLKIEFPEPWNRSQTGWRLSDRLWLEFGEKFEWPDMQLPEGETQGVFCYGLRDQIGVLCDGTVVPCCLDHEGDIPLGNLFEQTLDEIMESEKAVRFYESFSCRIAPAPLCRRCGYAERFSRKQRNG